MFFRLILMLIFFVLISTAILYLTSIVLNGMQSGKDEQKARDDARIKYLEIRRHWLNFALSDSPEYFASAMNDTTIPEVDRFQKHMASMQGRYGDLKEVTELSNSFAAQVAALGELFEQAVTAAKKKSL